MTVPKDCTCLLCDHRARCLERDVRVELKCETCGQYSIANDAMRTLGELSGAGRAFAGTVLRALLKTRRGPVEYPLITDEDVKAAESKRLA
jgi:hypothetical protein